MSAFLIKRGLWLIFVELVIVTFAWTFNPNFNIVIMQVIWAIGISMVCLGLLIYLPYRIILLLGVIIVFGHNLLDIPESAEEFKAGFWWDLLHHGYRVRYQFAPGHVVNISYAFVPWLGVMLLGYCTGIFFSSSYSAEQRKKILIRLGLVLIVFFIALRFTNVYGDPFEWTTQKNGLYTFLSFLKVHKYPPSLLYLCITLGPALILLSLLENVKNRFTGWMIIYGRTAFFYYVLHIYIIHLVAAIRFFARGHSFAEGSTAGIFPFLFVMPDEGYNLWIVYGVWLAIVIALFPLCKWYDNYKRNHREKMVVELFVIN